jgi:hypothetical protein
VIAASSVQVAPSLAAQPRDCEEHEVSSGSRNLAASAPSLLEHVSADSFVPTTFADPHLDDDRSRRLSI